MGRWNGRSPLPKAEHSSDWAAAKADLAILREELDGYVREPHRPGRNGWTPFRAIGTVLRAVDGGVPQVALSWPRSDAHSAGHWQRLVEAVEEAREVLRRAGAGRDRASGMVAGLAGAPA